MKTKKLYWKIEGFWSDTKTFERVLPAGSRSEKQIVVLLQRLAARHLDEDEIVSSSLRRNAPQYARFLETHTDSVHGHRYTIMTWDNPYYSASIWTAEELANRKE